ncbi:MAG: DUF1778 domain-containing protein [Betaproteobacteria bacterium]|nr:DUF1778 domain-containing protein [Betaproteobacteria bacterium]
MSTPAASRTSIINLRAPAAMRELIDQAARAQGKSRTEFMLDASSEKAQQVLLDRTVFVLDAKRHRRFVEALDAPLKNRKALDKLLARKALWER